MRSVAAALITALVLAGCGSSSASTSGGAHPGLAACGSSHGRTLAASSGARIYVVGRTVYGCASQGRRSYRLGARGVSCLGVGHVGAVAASASLAAYALQHCGVDMATSSIVVRRLTDGKIIASSDTATRVVAPESFQSITAIVITPDGAVAWIVSSSSVLAHRKTIEVHRLDRRGEALLDSGPSIVPASLTLKDSSVSWKHGAATRSATLR